MVSPLPAAASPADTASARSGIPAAQAVTTGGTLVGTTAVGRFSRPDLGPRPAAVTLVESDFRNRNSGMCLGAQGGSMANGTPVIQWPCDGTLNQQWVWYSDPFTVPLTQIRNGANLSKCLGVLGGNPTNGTPLVIWDCDGSTNQLWYDTVMADRDPNPCKQEVVNDLSASSPTYKVMGILGGSSAEGAPAVLWDLLFHPDQQWCQ
jgi:hypothetical protein